MRRLGAGRASEIFDLGDGRVLRRFKRGGDPAREARFMEHARAHGYPVPAVLEVRADALVLEKVEGPAMGDAMPEAPDRRLDGAAARLAALHEQLHAMPAPDGAGALLHLDLHPFNVLESPAGPVVIDWANARVGEPALDVALTYVILMTSGWRPGPTLGERFAAHIDVDAGLADAAAYRLRDRNLDDAERAAVLALAGAVR